MNLPFFSIVVPVYNVAPYLRECLDSVLAQTYPNWECLCVNDGSTDESGAILDEYAQKDTRFRVFHKKNGGVSAARNLALDNARGEWIGFLDSDDVLAPWTYLKVHGVVQACSKVDVVQYETTTFLENEQCRWGDAHVQECRYCQEDISDLLIASQITSCFWGKVYLKKRIEGIRFNSYTIGEDLLFLTQCMLQLQLQVRLGAICYGYRQRLTSVSHTSFTERKALDLIGYTSSILKECETHKLRVSSDYIRLTTNKLVEGFVASSYLLPNGGSSKLWNEWYVSLCQVGALGIMPLFQKVRIWFLVQLQFRWMASLLCYGPYKLKTMGIRRFWRG